MKKKKTKNENVQRAHSDDCSNCGYKLLLLLLLTGVGGTPGNGKRHAIAVRSVNVRPATRNGQRRKERESLT